MSDYLLGLATLPALFAGYVLVDWAHDSVTRWHTTTCGVCERKTIRKGPFRTLRLRLHCRHAHGLAMTLRGRVRRKQWHGLAEWYALRHGATSEEWRRAVEAHQ